MKMIKKILNADKFKYLLLGFFVLPFSTNYRLEGFSFGNAGGGIMSSTTYEMVGTAGELSSNNLSGNSYDLGAGLAFIRQANAPTVADFSNPSNYYNKLYFKIGTENNPSDTTYAIAISPNPYTTTYYVKNDHAIGSSLALTDYQTYTSWGGSSGANVIGLEPGTTYKIKIKAMHGKFSETDWGPSASAATVNPTLSFDIDVSASDTETAPPYSINLGDLNPGTVTDSTERIWVDLDTNATNGGTVFVYGQNNGLSSLSAGSTITAVTGDLSILAKGFGAQGVGATQSSGGPMSIAALYDTENNIVGITDTSVRQIFTADNPVSSGRASFIVKAKSDITTLPADDYTEILTVISAANF